MRERSLVLANLPIKCQNLPFSLSVKHRARVTDESNRSPWWIMFCNKCRTTVTQNGLSQYHVNHHVNHNWNFSINKYVWVGVWIHSQSSMNNTEIILLSKIISNYETNLSQVKKQTRIWLSIWNLNQTLN